VSLHIDTVANALNHNQVGFLPRGELFIDKVFLDHFFRTHRGEYIKQLARTAQCLGLSLIGMPLVAAESRSLLFENRYKELESYFTVGCINGPVSNLIERYGFLEAMLSLKNNPNLLRGLATNLLKDVEEKAKMARLNGFRAIAITDDIAGNSGLFFSLNSFVDLVWPVYRELREIIKENGLFSFFHSDGNIRKIVELLIEAGYDCLHPVDTQAGLNLYELKKEFGERISWMGHINIMDWKEEQINKEISLAEHSFKKGGLILGSTCGLSMEAVGDKLGQLYPQWKRKEPFQ
jgi:uroporphyrinogen-III decarboxylase